MSDTVAAPAQTAATAADEGQAGPVVSATDLTRRYGEGDTAVDALRGVSLDVPKGQLTAVMGPSGSGKSTLMHILAGLDKPTSGEVTIDGTAISKLNDSDLTKLRRRHIGFIFQFFNLLPMLTAEENILLPLSIAGAKPDRPWVDELLDRIGLADRRTHRPAELSGGQQQRVAIGRALVSKPTIVFPFLSISLTRSVEPPKLRMPPAAACTSESPRTLTSRLEGTVALPLAAPFTISLPEMTTLVFL